MNIQTSPLALLAGVEDHKTSGLLHQVNVCRSLYNVYVVFWYFMRSAFIIEAKKKKKTNER